MTLFRKWILSIGICLALLLPLGSVASADPGDGGFTPSFTSTSTSPAHAPPTTPRTDPGDGGW